MIKLIGSSKDLFDEYYKIRCDVSDIYWMGYSAPPEYNMIKRCYMERLESSPFSSVGDKKIYLIENCCDQIILGHMQLSLNKDGIEVGISIKKAYQGKGVGKESIRQIIIIAKSYKKPIYAKIRDDNIASIKSFTSMGFSPTTEYVLNHYPIVGFVKFRKYILTTIHS